jgi:hypothetical protein
LLLHLPGGLRVALPRGAAESLSPCRVGLLAMRCKRLHRKQPTGHAVDQEPRDGSEARPHHEVLRQYVASQLLGNDFAVACAVSRNKKAIRLSRRRARF